MWQYHPFTLTSAPEEDYISVHVRCVGNFTKALAEALGCNFSGKGADTSAVIGVNRVTSGNEVDPALRKILPRLYLDGPFGSASEDVFKCEVAILVGAGIGVTPFASILKSIWYRMNFPQKKTRLRKVYFFWVCRDFDSFEWFRSLLLAIEAQDLDNHIEIHTVSRCTPINKAADYCGHKLIFFFFSFFFFSLQYLTAPIKMDDATNIMINDTSTEQDAITGLRAPTNFGRPNWDAIFKYIRSIHSPGQAGVFFCGPRPLGNQLLQKCNMYSETEFTFAWGRENF